jgi:chaperonin GroES
MKNIKAINDMIIVKEVIKEEEKTEAGIFIPSTIKMEPQKYGKVLSVGDQVTKILVGDTIVFHPAGGQAVIMNGEIQRVLKENEVYGILE